MDTWCSSPTLSYTIVDCARIPTMAAAEINVRAFICGNIFEKIIVGASTSTAPLLEKNFE